MSENNEDLAGSPNPAKERRALLADLLPEAFSEGRLDVSALKRALGEDVVIEGGERYALTWAGKRDAYKVLQTPTTATIRPQRDLSINFDEAQHIFIEGENLEALKVLQKAYFGKVKLIYIDPPYNTGSDAFIYPDRFQESKEEYLKRINELADDGTLMREGFFRKNSRENGHFHSNWLSMMLPRLYIARNLLREDGAIFISCDDNEVHTLRGLLNEVFGEENFIVSIAWKKRSTPPNDKIIGTNHDYILCYAKNNLSVALNLKQRTVEQIERFSNPDNHPKGPWASGDLMANVKGGRYVASLYFPIVNPNTGEEHYPSSNGNWRFSKETIEKLLKNNEIYFGEDGRSRPKLKRFLSEVKEGITYPSIWDFVPLNTGGSSEMAEIFGDMNIFENPKPSGLIKELCKLGADNKSIILDFFAGSGTTGHAVLELNEEDGGSRKFLLIQIPEKLEEDSRAYGAGFQTIADIGRERLRRIIARIKESCGDEIGKGSQLAFKSFLLTPSNFKQWRGDGIETPEQLAEQVGLFVKSEKDGAEVEDILFELLLKFGQEPTEKIEPIEIAGVRVFAIHERKMLFVLDGFTEEMIEPLLSLKPREIIALDSAFHDSDELKSNLDLHCRDAGVKFTCI